MMFIREIWQHGMMVARVECADEAQADREAGHYVAVYAQDGDVSVIARNRRHIPPPTDGMKET
jgi:hypothetical protein